MKVCRVSIDLQVRGLECFNTFRTPQTSLRDASESVELLHSHMAAGWEACMQLPVSKADRFYLIRPTDSRAMYHAFGVLQADSNVFSAHTSAISRVDSHSQREIGSYSSSKSWCSR